MAAQMRLAHRATSARAAIAGPEIRAADADIDDIGHGLAQGAAQTPLAHVGGEGEHLCALRGDIGREVSAFDHDGVARRSCAAPYAAPPGARSY